MRKRFSERFVKNILRAKDSLRFAWPEMIRDVLFDFSAKREAYHVCIGGCAFELPHTYPAVVARMFVCVGERGAEEQEGEESPRATLAPWMLLLSVSQGANEFHVE